MAKILGTQRGFGCPCSLAPKCKARWSRPCRCTPRERERERESEYNTHHISGLEHVASADLVILFTRLLPLPVMERERIVTYADSGKPIIALRTANHGFRDTLPYQINGKQFRWGDDVLGGAFMGHLKVAAIPTSAFVGSRPAGVGGLTGAR